jgi:hypothetical protein
MNYLGEILHHDSLTFAALVSLMKMPIRGKNPPVLRPAPFGKGGHWGIFRRCFERGAAHFHLLCCADGHMSYFARDIPIFWLRLCRAGAKLVRRRRRFYAG